MSTRKSFILIFDRNTDTRKKSRKSFRFWLFPVFELLLLSYYGFNIFLQNFNRGKNFCRRIVGKYIINFYHRIKISMNRIIQELLVILIYIDCQTHIIFPRNYRFDFFHQKLKWSFNTCTGEIDWNSFFIKNWIEVLNDGIILKMLIRVLHLYNPTNVSPLLHVSFTASKSI